MPTLDRRKILDFWQNRSRIETESSTRFHTSHLQYDLAALAPYCTSETTLLELGCGRCTMLNPLVSDYGITAHGVDVVPAFLRSAIEHPRLTVEAADAVNYQPRSSFDIILLAGLISCIPEQEDRTALYMRAANALTDQGFLFIKSQFGRTEDVSIDAWSDALEAHYTSFYPSIETEADLLSKWFSVDVRDAYPAELSPHRNTKFFHLLCRPLSK